jgi:hypothetical protein
MQFFHAYARRRAVRRYARELPRRLSTDYGGGEFFTPPQIRAAAATLGLDPALIGYGYAMFTPEAEFYALDPSLRGALSYRDARAELARYIARSPSATGDFQESGIGLVAGWQGDGSGQGGG